MGVNDTGPGVWEAIFDMVNTVEGGRGGPAKWVPKKQDEGGSLNKNQNSAIIIQLQIDQYYYMIIND